jgi:hypothetical protein
MKSRSANLNWPLKITGCSVIQVVIHLEFYAARVRRPKQNPLLPYEAIMLIDTSNFRIKPCKDKLNCSPASMLKNRDFQL